MYALTNLSFFQGSQFIFLFMYFLHFCSIIFEEKLVILLD